MLTKAQIKYIQSVTQHKFREQEQVFLAEGSKLAEEWLRAQGKIRTIAALPDWIAANLSLIALHPEAELFEVDEVMLSRLSMLQTPNNVVLVAETPSYSLPQLKNGWYLALDAIQDPGNMGTLIRIADWFGITDIFCGDGCADVYNPKVVQAAMGGHLRVHTHRVDLPSWLADQQLPVYGALLDGVDLYSLPPAAAGVIIIGNESRGISESVAATCSLRVRIPGKGGAESLNAAVSAGILCSWLTRPVL